MVQKEMFTISLVLFTFQFIELVKTMISKWFVYLYISIKYTYFFLLLQIPL